MIFNPFQLRRTALLRVVLIAAVALALALYALAAAPGLLAEGKGEMPPMFARLVRLLGFLLP
jgi:hypothetical protein